MVDKMAEDHARDYAAKAKIDAVRYAVADLATDPDVWNRIGEEARTALHGVQGSLTKASDRIVAVWD